MECSKFVEEKIADTDSPEFRAHRVGCPGCVRDLEELDEIRDLYREASVESYRGALPRVRRFPRAAWSAVAAAVMMVAVFVAIMMPAKSPEVPLNGTAVLVRIPLEPWGREEERLDRAMDELFDRVQSLERRPR